MPTLIKQLTEATQILKEEYLEKTEVYARSFHAVMIDQNFRNDTQWWDAFGVKWEWVTDKHTKRSYPGNPTANGVTLYNSVIHRKIETAKSKSRKIAGTPVEEFVKKELDWAEEKYQQDVQKLAERIEKKGLDQDKLTTISGRVETNIEITITDGAKTVRAWTIIAGGPIQRPHYRYLVN